MLARCSTSFLCWIFVDEASFHFLRAFKSNHENRQLLWHMTSSDRVPPMLCVKACTLFVVQEVSVCVKRGTSGVALSAFQKSSGCSQHRRGFPCIQLSGVCSAGSRRHQDSCSLKASVQLCIGVAGWLSRHDRHKCRGPPPQVRLACNRVTCIDNVSRKQGTLTDQ